MNVNDALFRARELAWWLLPLGALMVVLGVETRWGERVATPAAAPPANAPTPIAPALLPEYEIPGGMDARKETVNRTLFNPTRRPAPALAEVTPKPQMPRGQFALTGTTVAEGKSTAFLREVSGGKFRRVQQGDTVNGMRVAEVKPDRVKLTMGDESEELVLKVIPNSKTTPGTAPPSTPQVASAPGGAPGATAAQVQTDGQSLLERRRAARAAAAAAIAAGGNQNLPPEAPPTPGGSVPPPAPSAAAPAGGTSAQGQATWADVFRTYQQRGGARPAR